MKYRNISSDTISIPEVGLFAAGETFESVIELNNAKVQRVDEAVSDIITQAERVAPATPTPPAPAAPTPAPPTTAAPTEEIK